MLQEPRLQEMLQGASPDSQQVGRQEWAREERGVEGRAALCTSFPCEMGNMVMAVPLQTSKFLACKLSSNKAEREQELLLLGWPEDLLGYGKIRAAWGY
jgi:hypothetical protein